MLVAIDTGITDELKTEGLYREILRHCQVLRKEAGFAVSDKVLLDFETEAPSLAYALNEYGIDIMRETLSEIRHIQVPLAEKEIHLDDGRLTIRIAK